MLIEREFTSIFWGIYLGIILFGINVFFIWCFLSEYSWLLVSLCRKKSHFCSLSSLSQIKKKPLNIYWDLEPKLISLAFLQRDRSTWPFIGVLSCFYASLSNRTIPPFRQSLPFPISFNFSKKIRQCQNLKNVNRKFSRRQCCR